MVIRHYGPTEPDEMQRIVEAAAKVQARRLEITREDSDAMPTIDQWGGRIPLYRVAVEFDGEEA